MLSVFAGCELCTDLVNKSIQLYKMIDDNSSSDLTLLVSEKRKKSSVYFDDSDLTTFGDFCFKTLSKASTKYRQINL